MSVVERDCKRGERRSFRTRHGLQQTAGKQPDFKSIQLISCLEYTLLNLASWAGAGGRSGAVLCVSVANVFANDYSGHLWLSVHYTVTSVPAVNVSKFSGWMLCIIVVGRKGLSTCRLTLVLAVYLMCLESWLPCPFSSAKLAATLTRIAHWYWQQLYALSCKQLLLHYIY